MNGSNGKCDDVFWTDQQQQPAIKFDTSPSIKNDCILCVHKQQQQQQSLCKERREREKRILGNEWMIETSATLLVYRLKRESHAYNNNHHVFIFISILFSHSLHCLPV